jgi:Glycosyltransferase family 28 C-terminal domain
MIGYYIHHVGAGHLQQARCIAAELSGGVTGLSSLAMPPGWPGAWVRLARDDTAACADRPTASGQLHWAPLHDAGLRGRMAAIAAWISQAAPQVMMVDVSVEVSALARLMGVPVVTMVLPGRRSDQPHRLGYALADMLIAPWLPSMSGLLLDDTDPAGGKMHHVGAFSRFDGRRPEPGSGVRGGPPTVLVLHGLGGSATADHDLWAAAAATPGWNWVVLGGRTGRWEDDPWTALCRADVVVTHAGQNAVAEIAAARKPAVIIPQPRPHGEQLATARALASAGLAVTVGTWPAAADWPSVLRAAISRGGDRWESWSSGTGARRAATLIESVDSRTGPALVTVAGRKPCAPLS